MMGACSNLSKHDVHGQHLFRHALDTPLLACAVNGAHNATNPATDCINIMCNRCVRPSMFLACARGGPHARRQAVLLACAVVAPACMCCEALLWHACV